MLLKSLSFCYFITLIISCQKPATSTLSAEKQIIETLEKETQYFCERNLDKWQEQWSTASFVSKMYTGQQEFKEFVGWNAIKQNTVDHIQQFPEAIPIPDSNQEYTIELFENTAFVFYAKQVDNNRIRETRFMVKEGKKWKIARMQTIF